MKLEAIDTHLVLMVEFITTVELFLNGVSGGIPLLDILLQCSRCHISGWVAVFKE